MMRPGEAFFLMPELDGLPNTFAEGLGSTRITSNWMCLQASTDRLLLTATDWAFWMDL